jgi:hypothetical protein
MGENGGGFVQRVRTENGELRCVSLVSYISTVAVFIAALAFLAGRGTGADAVADAVEKRMTERLASERGITAQQQANLELRMANTQGAVDKLETRVLELERRRLR